MSSLSSPQSLSPISPLKIPNACNASEEFLDARDLAQLSPLPEFDQYFMDTQHARYPKDSRLSVSDDESLYRRTIVYLGKEAILEKTADKIEFLHRLLEQWSQFKETFFKELEGQIELNISETGKHAMLAAIKRLKQDQSESRGEIQETIELLSLHLDENNPILLHHAAYHNYFALIKLIIFCGGIDPNAQDEQGNSALHWAVAKQNYQSIEMLLRCGALLNMPNDEGRAPIDYARDYKMEKFFEILHRLEKGSE